MKWKPDVRTGIWVGLGIILGLVLIDGALLWRVVRGPINGLTFICALLVLLSLPTIVSIGYRVYNLTRLRYEFDRNRLLIFTAATRQIIPMNSIEQVIDGQSLEFKVKMHGLTWPGYQIGSGTIEGLGLTLSFAVTSPHEQVFVVTPTLTYGISVEDIDTFIEVFGTARQLGPSLQVQQESVQSTYVHWAIWRDRLAQGLLVANIVLSATLFAILCFRYPKLPPLLPLHYDVTGQVDRISPRKDVFVMPIISLIAWLANGALGGLLYRRERFASYLAWSGALLVQILFLLALWNIVL